jgi:hypothetical protein
LKAEGRGANAESRWLNHLGEAAAKWPDTPRLCLGGRIILWLHYFPHIGWEELASAGEQSGVQFPPV